MEFNWLQTGFWLMSMTPPLMTSSTGEDDANVDDADNDDDNYVDDADDVDDADNDDDDDDDDDDDKDCDNDNDCDKQKGEKRVYKKPNSVSEFLRD